MVSRALTLPVLPELLFSFGLLSTAAADAFALGAIVVLSLFNMQATLYVIGYAFKFHLGMIF